MRVQGILRRLVPVILLCAVLPAAGQYSARSLGYGVAYDINNNGAISGSLGPMETQHAFIYSGGVITDLGTLGGNFSFATSLNDSGNAVGVYGIWAGVPHGFRYSAGSMGDIGTLGNHTWANAINGSGIIVGESVLPSGMSRAFRYSGSAMVDLGTLGGDNSSASGINAAGSIVGSASTTNQHTHAFLYLNGTMTDLGTLDGAHSRAQGINDAGVVVGFSSVSGGNYNHAFRYDNGVMSDLGTLGGAYSLANAINSSGAIVGNADTFSQQTHAFIYQNGKMTDLAPFLTTIGITGRSEALGINDQGDIVGTGNDSSGNRIAFVLTIPEPSVLGILIVGLIPLGWRLSSQSRKRA